MSAPDDEVLGAYSSSVMWRLLRYLKPYKRSVLATLITLVLVTLAELFSPIVMRRALDDHLLKQHLRLSLNLIEEASAGQRIEGLDSDLALVLLDKGQEISEGLYVLPSALKDLSSSEKTLARSRGWLDDEAWYLFANPPPDAREVISSHQEFFLSAKVDDGLIYAIRIDDRAKLSPSEVGSIRSNDFQGMKKRAWQYLGILLVFVVFSFVQIYLASWIGQRVMADIRQKLLHHILNQSLRYFGKKPAGALVSRVANDVETINEFFTNVAISFLNDLAVMGGVIGVLYVLDQRLAFICSLTLIPTFALIVIFRNRIRETFRQVRNKVSGVNTYLAEHLGGMATVQLFAAEKRSAAEFEVKGKDLFHAQINEMRIMAIFRPLIDLFASIALALVVWYSTGMHDGGMLTLGVLIAFIRLIQKFFDPVKDIAEKFTILQSAMAGAERIFAMLDADDSILDTTKEKSESLIKKQGNPPQYGEICFENVHFSYLPGEPILKDISFRVAPGETVAIVGSTGAGKTTIANLLTRFWDVDSGRILLDGEDIRHRSLSDLRREVQPVQQDVFLFNETIAENILLGLPLSQEKLEEAAKLSRADAFIQSLPEAYQTILSEEGINLSAGQGQLLTFARIIAHNPRIIILDEATANVDTETETLLQEGLDTLLQNRSALIIAHRLSTVRRADRILVLGKGKLLEQGSHKELIARKGLYHKLYEQQFSDEGPLG